MSDQNPIWLSAGFYVDRKNHYPEDHLTFIGNETCIVNKMPSYNYGCWIHIEDNFFRFRELLQNVEYTALTNGLFKY